jgi:hypothetical protein
MRSVRKLLFAVGLATGLGLIPITAMAETTTIADSVFGVEVNFIHTDSACPDYSSFVGSANGSAPGFWNATVGHQALDTRAGQTTLICAGTFTLNTQLDEDPAVVKGDFTSGGISALPATCYGFFSIGQCSGSTNAGTSCTQSFLVNGGLAHVGTGGSNNGTGTFSATLTHYGRWYGNCVVVVPPPPTVVGTVSLIF